MCVWYISEENVLISLKDYIERVHFIYAKYIFWGEGGEYDPDIYFWDSSVNALMIC